jgi:proprotein convertase subtilisin/kexin type 5
MILFIFLYFHRSFLLDTHCERCQSPCSTCKSSTSCLTCNDKTVLLIDQCIDKCPDGYYSNIRQCLPCNPMCGACTGKD